MKKPVTPQSIAIVHDALREYGGAERVLEALHRLYPNAPVFVSYMDKSGLGNHANRFSGWDIRESWLARAPFLAKNISPLRFLAPRVWKSINLSSFDVVITSSGWFIPRGVTLGKHTRHVCYLHHPPRNLYGYATGSTYQKHPVVRLYAAVINFFLRQYDYASAQTVHTMIANSKETASRAWKFYRKRSLVIYPPVDVPQKPLLKQADTQKLLASLGVVSGAYYLSVSRLSWAKRVDVAIEACNKIGAPLVVVGAGKEEASLRALAGPSVHFAGPVSDAQLDTLYRNAKALLFCALEEDFGMVPVEAMGRGTPVVALAEGGVRETVIEGKTGALFAKPTPDLLVAALDLFEKKYSPSWKKQCVLWARRFSGRVFDQHIRAAVCGAGASSL